MMRILVINEDEAVRATIGRILRLDAHDVVLTADGQAGIQRARQQDFDLAICDVVDPDMDGLETVRELRRLSRTMPIIPIFESSAATDMDGMDRPGLLSMADASGATRPLVKPFTGIDLLAMVRDLLGSRR